MYALDAQWFNFNNHDFFLLTSIAVKWISFIIGFVVGNGFGLKWGGGEVVVMLRFEHLVKTMQFFVCFCFMFFLY